VLGAGFKRLIVDPLIKHGVIPLVIATLGLSIAVKSAVRAGYSAEAHPFPSPSPAASSRSPGINVSYADIGTLVLAGAIVIALQAFINKTVTGARCRPSRRTPKRRRCSASMSRRMVLYVFVINAVLAGGRRAPGDPDLPRQVRHGDSIGQKAFFAAIIGGFNQTRGALLGGVLIGVLENLVGSTFRPHTRKAWPWCCSCS
jgi:branched-chain amino acid transport system permease protein